MKLWLLVSLYSGIEKGCHITRRTQRSYVNDAASWFLSGDDLFVFWGVELSMKIKKKFRKEKSKVMSINTEL